MRDYLKFYIDGQWVDPVEPRTLDVINPATEGVAGRISLGSAADVDRAAQAARRAFADKWRGDHALLLQGDANAPQYYHGRRYHRRRASPPALALAALG